MSSAATWITRLDIGSRGTRVAVKDLFDIAGVPTTAGCRAVAEGAPPAPADAACLAGLQAAVEAGDARVVGKANLHELALGASGLNPWFGTPVNPLDSARVPGGSSSGSAVAVAGGEADVAFGSDTGGSVRIPAACCGVAGLKTTAGRIPTGGVWPLAPTLDTVGPLAPDVAGLVAGMRLLEPGFAAGPALAGPVGRLRAFGAGGEALVADPEVEVAIDAAIAAAGFEVVDVPVRGWTEAVAAAMTILGAEAAWANLALAREHPEGIGADVRRGLEAGRRVGRQELLSARARAKSWRERWDTEVFTRVSSVVAPVLDGPPPRLEDDLREAPTVRWTSPVNLAGLPALALPVPMPAASRSAGRGSRLPTSLQLIGPPEREPGLLALGAWIEAAVAR